MVRLNLWQRLCDAFEHTLAIVARLVGDQKKGLWKSKSTVIRLTYSFLVSRSIINSAERKFHIHVAQGICPTFGGEIKVEVETTRRSAT